MIQAYNFLASWQLFPEKGTYESGDRPKSGYYRIEAPESRKALRIEQNWVSLENQSFNASYLIEGDAGLQPFADQHFAEQTELRFPDAITMEVDFHKDGQLLLSVTHEIMPNGYLMLITKGFNSEGKSYTNTEVYHKQLSVLPYSASVSGAVIKANEEGLIRHKALTAMEEQTNMQLDQIRKQIELLALQAQEIQKRKELSLMIYEAKLNFSPVIGQTYYLYERKDETLLLSLVSPREWGGGSGPFKRFIAMVKLLADHTWVEL